MKVQDLAKQLGEKPKDFIRFLFEVNVRVKSPTAKLDRMTVQKVKNIYLERKRQEKNVLDMGEEVLVELKEWPKTLGDLIDKTGASMSDMMRVVLSKGLLLNVNSEIDPQLAQDLGSALNITMMVEEDESSKQNDLKKKLDSIQADQDDDLCERPPVVTIMGHVDHGKTALLDALRNTNVVDKEAGGITQHIGAYQVKHSDGKLITFMDTPGHEAFTAIRARGAQVTDIVILVVAADDGVKPQTLEALSHAKAASIPIIVAINKIDKPEADLDKCKQQLSQHDLIAEDWGGDTIFVPVSAKKKQGLDELLNMIGLVAEMLELKTAKNCLAKAVVIESQLSSKQGPQATVLVKTGTLKKLDHIEVGAASGRIRAMFNDASQAIDLAEPGAPVRVLGLDQVPSPGDILTVYESDKELKKAVALNKEKSSQLNQSKLTSLSLDNLSDQISQGDIKQINLIVRADVSGSLEAILASLRNINQEQVVVQVLHAATGSVTEGDINLAHSSGAVVLVFNSSIPNAIKSFAEKLGVSLKSYSIIYQLIEDIENVLSGIHSVSYVEEEIGTCEVREIFKFSKIGMIAGSYVTQGKIKRGAIVKVIRDGEEILKTTLTSLKRFKDNVKEVLEGFECGVVLEQSDDIKIGDQLVMFEEVEKKVV